MVDVVVGYTLEARAGVGGFGLAFPANEPTSRRNVCVYVRDLPGSIMKIARSVRKPAFSREIRVAVFLSAA